MIAPPESPAARPTPESASGRIAPNRDSRHRRREIARRISALGPYAICLLQLVLGYLHYAPGTAYSLSPDHYRAWAFPAFRYSDIIWLYLRDRLDTRPIPYVDYPLEYPPLTGLVSWVASLAPDLPGYYRVAYLLTASGLLAAIWSLRRLPGANPWYLAAAPAVFFYSGHQWEPVIVGVTALSLVAVARGHDRLGAFGLAAAVSLKLFPIAFLAALCVERLRQRAWRSFAEIVAIALATTLVVNLPFALANRANWAFFFAWNRDRLADSGIWVLFRGTPTGTLTTASLVLALVGAAVLALVAFRLGGPLVVPLGSTALLWWLLVNKTFTTHLVLWVLLAVALLRPPFWLWLAVVLVDIASFQLGNYLNLYNVPEYQSAPLVQQAVARMYDPLQIVRTLVLAACVGWGLLVLWRYRGTIAAVPDRPPDSACPVPDGPPLPPVAIDPRPMRLAWVLGPPAIFLAVSVATSWPIGADPRSATVVGFDPLLQIWLSRWVQHALATDPRALWSANIFTPFPDTLAYTDANIPGAILAWPIDLLARDPLLTNAVMMVLAGVLGGLGVHLVVARLTGNRAAGLIAGTAWILVPFRAVHLWHLNWLEGAAWLPWVFLAALLLLRRPTAGRGVVLGALCATLILTSFYFALQLAILLGATVVAVVPRRDARYTKAAARSLAVAAAVVALIVGPFTGPYLRVRAEQGLERGLDEAERYKAAPMSYLTLPPWDEPNGIQRLLGIRAGANEALTTVGQATHADGHRHGEIVIEDALYPGVVVLVLAAVGLAVGRPRRIAFALFSTAVLAFVLSLGPSLGQAAGDGTALPYRWLFDHAPGFTAMRVPARLGGLVAFALVLLAGLGAAVLWASFRHRLWAPAGLRSAHLVPAVAATATALTAIVIGIDLYAGPAPVEAVDRSADATAVYDWLATQPPGAVMEFPAESIFLDPAGSSVRRHVGLSMLWSTRHWLPLVNGNSGFIPRAYSELLETFVGNLRRADGTLALRLSYPAADRIPLLRQLGVRYLVFHRSQYAPADWATIEDRMRRDDGRLVEIGSFGEAAVWRLSEPLTSPPPPVVSLFAPTILGPDDGWAPVLVADTPVDGPSLLSLTRPAAVTVTWYDASGRYLRTERLPEGMPPLVSSRRLVCTTSACTASNSSVDAAPLPPPPSGWRPTAPGHYAVKVSLSGDRPIACRIDLDVVDSAAEVARLAPDDGLRWAKCVPADSVPVNDPGRPATRVLGPSVTFVDGNLAASATVATAADQQMRGWLLLGIPGDPAPWLRPTWTSSVVQRLVTRDLDGTFAWSERPGLAPGVYGLTLWFHRLGDLGWTHADGGGYGLPSVIVDPGGGMRWAGPARLTVLAPPATIVPGRPALVPLAVRGIPDGTRCASRWVLRAADGAIAGRGGGGGCETARVALPADIASGRYLLELDILSIRDDTATVNDGTSLPVIVGERRAGPR